MATLYDVFILCLCAVSAVSGYGMQGGLMTFRPRGKNSDGSITVDFKFKGSFNHPHEYLYWTCSSGDCGLEWYSSYGLVDKSEHLYVWYQTEGHSIRHVYSDKPFQLNDSRCCWVGNSGGANGWSLITDVDLGTRSDTFAPNNSPVTTIFPILRVPQNCPTSFKLMAHDPDGDIVRCRYGHHWTGECDTCFQHPNFHLNQDRCVLSLTSEIPQGSYVLELVLEDFPHADINLTYNDGSVSYKYKPNVRKSREASKNTRWHANSFRDLQAGSSLSRKLDKLYYGVKLPNKLENMDAFLEGSSSGTTAEDITSVTSTIPTPTSDPGSHSLSKIPLQFIVEVTAPIDTCDYGVFRPKFISPTPRQGEILHARAGTPFQLHLSAQATQDSISDFKVSGPTGLSKRFTSNTRSSTGMTVEWTPSEDDTGEHVAFCFFAETDQWHSSEFRCVLVLVDSKILNTVLTCNENTMTLLIKKSSTNGLYENHLQLNDPMCLLSSNSTHHIASVGFNSCGTEVEETEHEIVFKNKVTSFEETLAVISRKHQVIIPFNCSFPKESRVSASFRAHKAVFEFTEAAFGNFTYKFQFYTDDQFLIVQTQTPLEVMLRDMLYMEIQVASSLPNVQLFVESCRATPHDNPNDPVFYNIIDNGCIMDETMVFYEGTNTQSRFGIEAFAFIGDYEEVYLSCTVILCKLGDPNTRCARGCTTESPAETEARRHKRSLTSEASESLQHFISQGPLRMTQQSSSEDSDGKATLNVNTLVVSLSGVVVVALVATTIIVYMKKAKMSQYQRLPTDDL